MARGTHDGDLAARPVHTDERRHGRPIGTFGDTQRTHLRVRGCAFSRGTVARRGHHGTTSRGDKASICMTRADRRSLPRKHEKPAVRKDSEPRERGLNGPCGP